MDKQTLTVNDLTRRLITRNDVREGDLAAVARTVTETTAKYLQAERVTVWLKAANTDKFCAQDVYNADIQQHDTAPMLSLDMYHNLQTALYTERYLLIESADSDMRTKQIYKDLWKKDNIKTVLMAPILARGAIRGFIQVDQRDIHKQYSAEDVNLAIQLADVMGRTFLNKKISKKARTINLMTNLFATTATEKTSDMTDWLTRLVTLVDAKMGMVFLMDLAARQLVCSTAINTDVDVQDLRVNLGEDAVGIAAETNTAILVRDYDAWQHAKKFTRDTFTAKTVLAVPLAVKSTVKAVAVLINKTDDQIFDDQDLFWAKTFANQTKSAIINFDTVIHRTRLEIRTSILDEVLDAANNALDASHLLQMTKSILSDRLNVRTIVMEYEDHLIVKGITKKAAVDINATIHQEAMVNKTMLIQNTDVYNGVLKPAVTQIRKMKIDQLIVAAKTVTNGTNVMVWLGADAENQFTDQDVGTVRQVMDVLAAQLNRLALFNHAQAQDILLTKMRDIGYSLNRLINFEDAVTVIGREAVRLLDAQAGLILLENENRDLLIPWIEGVGTQKYYNAVHDTLDTMRTIFMAANYPTTIKDISVLNLPTALQTLLTADRIQTIQTIPFIFNDRVTGVMLTLFDHKRKISAAELRILNMFASQATLTIQNARMYEQLENGYIDVVLALAKTMDERELTVSDISLRIADLAEKSARRLGLPEEEIRDLHWAALLHDIGKITVSEDILLKEGELNKKEWAEIKKHPVKGEEILQPVSRFKNVGRIIRNFREKYDGSGYPDNLKGNQIPVAARVLCVADAYESMITDRAYKKAFTMEEALAEIEKSSGTQFDPMVVQTFMATVRDHSTVN